MGERIRRYKEKHPREGFFGPTPLAEFGADAARSFADRTTSVKSRRARWRSGSRRSSAGYTETGVMGKIHLDIATALLLYYQYTIFWYRHSLL